jgi:hypothetical protein
MSPIYQIIEQIAATSSLKEKQAIFERNQGNDALRLSFLYAENPRFNFWIRGVDPSIPAESYGLLGGKQIDQSTFKALDELINRKVTGNAARERLIDILSEHDPHAAVIINRIVNRDLRCGAGTSISNKVWKGLIPEYPVMLCGKYDAKAEKYLAGKGKLIAQKKSDGGRVNIKVDLNGGVTYHSRSGSVLNLYGAFDSVFTNFPGQVFDGELLVKTANGVADRKTGNGFYTKAVRNTLSEAEAARFVMDIWDVIPTDVFHGVQPSTETYRTRLKNVTRMLTKVDSRIEVSEGYECDSMAECMAVYDVMRARGEEGIIIKVLDGAIWEDRRSKDCVKVKAEETGDFLCTGWEYGTPGTQYEKMLGNLKCETSDGLCKFNVGSGFNDLDREDPDQYVGRIIEIKYNEVIASRARKDGTKSLFLPIFSQIRFDKTVANSLAELK